MLKYEKKHILVACEESQRLTVELRKLGINAYSCDLLETSGEHPEWHIVGDVLPLLNGYCKFTTQDLFLMLSDTIKECAAKP